MEQQPKLYAVLYKTPVQVGEPYPIAAVVVTTKEDILASPPASDKFPKYQTYWKKLGAPVRLIGTWDVASESWTSKKYEPIEYLIQRKAKKPVASNGDDVKALAVLFVRTYVKRAWTDTDYRGMHMAQAKKLLASYTMKRIVDTLAEMNRGTFTDGVPWVKFTEKWNNPGWFSMNVVTFGEPPYIERVASAPSPATGPNDYIRWCNAHGTKVEMVVPPPQVSARDFSERPAWA